MKNLPLSLLLTTTPVFAGVEAPIMAPPAPDCEAGWTIGLEALYLRPYQSEGDYTEGDFDFGGRGSIGYDFNDCLFVKATYFGYNSTVLDESFDGDGEDTSIEAEIDVSYLDLVVGEHFKPSEKLKLSPYVGLRWATYEESGHIRSVGERSIGTASGSAEFSGLGVVVGIDGVRTLGNGFSLYGTAKQSVVFGTTDFSFRVGVDGISPQVVVDSDSFSDDRVIFISELGLGVQYDFNIGSAAANIRAGVEGQWWAGASEGFGQLSNGNSANAGLGGFVLGGNVKF